MHAHTHTHQPSIVYIFYVQTHQIIVQVIDKTRRNRRKMSETKQRISGRSEHRKECEEAECARPKLTKHITARRKSETHELDGSE